MTTMTTMTRRIDRPQTQTRGGMAAALLLAAFTLPTPGLAEHWANKLRFGDVKVLILHADDGGMFAGSNSAILALLAEDEIQSASLMVPTAYYGDFVSQYAALGENYDVGIHMTLNSEWSTYRWGAIYQPPKDVKRILEHKFWCWGWRPVFPKTVVGNFLCRAPRTMKREGLAQLTVATDGGEVSGGVTVPALHAAPTHIDSHQGGVFVRPSHFRRYLEMAMETGIPVMTFENWEQTRNCLVQLPDDSTEAKLVDFVALRLLSLRRVQNEVAEDPDWQFPRVDQYCGIPYGDDLASSEEKFKQMVTSLPNGITQIMFHPSDEDPLLRASMGAEKANRRIAIDREIFRAHGKTGPEWESSVRKWLKDQGVVFTNWHKMMARYNDPCSDPMDDAPWSPC